VEPGYNSNSPANRVQSKKPGQSMNAVLAGYNFFNLVAQMNSAALIYQVVKKLYNFFESKNGRYQE
jgi:hypothetical protein